MITITQPTTDSPPITCNLTFFRHALRILQRNIENPCSQILKIIVVKY